MDPPPGRQPIHSGVFESDPRSYRVRLFSLERGRAQAFVIAWARPFHIPPLPRHVSMADRRVNKV